MTRPTFSRWAVPAMAGASVVVVVVRNSQGLANLLIDTLSPAETMVISSSGTTLANGFPSGAELTALSAPLRLYALFGAAGLGVVGATEWMIALEALALFAGIYAAVRILRPTTTSLVAASSATLATVGYALNGHNLANFGFLYGWNYGFATAVAVVALAYALRRRWTACAIAVVVVALIHSVIAVLVVLSLVPLVVIDVVRRRFALRWRPVALAAAVAVAYLLASRGDVQLPSGRLDVGAYIARVRAFQSHYFFQFSTSFLRTFAEDIASWLIAVVLLVVVGMALRRLGDGALADRLVVLLTAIGALSALGWAHSNLSQPDVTVLVLTLHRSSTFVNLLLLALVVPLLFEQALQRRRSVTAAVVAVWCLLPNPVDHARLGAVVLALALWWLVDEVRHGPRPSSVVAVAVLTPVVGFAVHFLIVSPGIAGPGWDEFFDAVADDGGLILLGAVLVGLAVFAHRRRSRGTPVGQGIAIAGTIVGALVLLLGRTVFDNPRGFTGDAEQRHEALLDVAAWVRRETPPDAVFLLPLIDDGFGWRTFAERESAGLPREWLHYSFLYSRDEQVMEEGTRRAELLGIDVDDWLEEHPRIGAGDQLVAELADRFERMTDTEVARFAEELDADYVVVDADARRSGPCFVPVYENDTYDVLQVEKDCPTP